MTAMHQIKRCFHNRTVVLVSLDARKRHDAELDQLYRLRERSEAVHRHLLTRQINDKGIFWNEVVLRKKDEIDLHRMTKRGALAFVWRRARKMRNDEELSIVTGRGKHSKGGASRIKDLVLETF